MKIFKLGKLSTLKFVKCWFCKQETQSKLTQAFNNLKCNLFNVIGPVDQAQNFNDENNSRKWRLLMLFSCTMKMSAMEIIYPYSTTEVSEKPVNILIGLYCEICLAVDHNFLNFWFHNPTESSLPHLCHICVLLKNSLCVLYSRPVFCLRLPCLNTLDFVRKGFNGPEGKN